MIVASEEGHTLWLPDAGPTWTVGDATAQLDQAFPHRANVITHVGRATADAAQRIRDVCALCGHGEQAGASVPNPLSLHPPCIPRYS